MIAFAIPALLMALLLAHGLFLFRPSKKSIMHTPWFVIACVLMLPSFDSSFIGHESSYFELYQGGDWMVGNTLTYPSMQLWWKVWGWLVRHSQWGIPAVLLLTAASCLHIFFLILLRVTESTRLSILGSTLLLLHPDFASWMGHMYNIIPPLLCALYAQLLVQKQNKRELLFGVLALSLSILMRIEYILLIPFFLVQVSHKEKIQTTVLGGIVCGLGLLPILSEVPGEGERILSFFINLPILSYWTPALWVTIPLLILGRDKRSITIGVYILILHLIFCTFNDYGTRHILFVMPIIIWAICSQKSIFTIGLFSLAIVWGRVERHVMYEASEEDFAEYIEQTYPNLPRLTIAQAKTEGCAWIVEEEPFLSDPVRSHFNLYSPQEEQQLRKEYGCIQWCSTKEDWRWSPLAVQERAIRLHSLYAMEAVSIVAHNGSQCIVHKVGTRRR